MGHSAAGHPRQRLEPPDEAASPGQLRSLAHPDYLPALIAASLVGLLLFTRRGQDTAAFAAGTGLIISLLVSAALSVYPDLLHSTIAPRYNLNIANTAS